MTDIAEWEQNMKDRGMKPSKRKYDPNHDSEALKGLVEEAMDAKGKMELFKGSIADIRTRAKDELGVTPSMFNKLLNLRFKQNRDEVEDQNDELIDTYDNLYKPKPTTGN